MKIKQMDFITGKPDTKAFIPVITIFPLESKIIYSELRITFYERLYK